MLIYILNFILNMGLGFLILGKNPRETTNTKKAIYLLITFVQLGLLSGLRGESVGYDTTNYYTAFSNSVSGLKEGLINPSGVEWGFYQLSLLIGALGGNASVLILVCALFIMGSCCLFIYRHSENVLMSVFIIMSFPYFYSSFDIVRHFIATSFFLLAYKYLENRKLIPYLILLLIGSQFHLVALFFIPLYFVRNLRNTPLTWGVAGVSSLVLCFFLKDMARIVISLVERWTHYMNDTSTWLEGFGGGIKTAVLYGALLLIALALYNNKKERGFRDECALHYVLLLFCFSVIFINVRMMTRFIMTFGALLAIAIPRLTSPDDTHSEQTANVLSVATVVLGLVYHGFMLFTNWQNVVPYVSIFS